MKSTVFKIGLGWMAVEMLWDIYNANMPLLYRDWVGHLPLAGTLVGLLMTTDNVANLFLSPFIGLSSDKTRSRWGRRLPYIMIGMPLAAALMVLLPFAARTGLLALVLAAVMMNLSMTIFRSPFLSFFSDLFPKKIRTQVSGTTDLMASIAAIIATLGGGALLDINPVYPWLMAAFMTLIAVVALRTIKEPDADTVANDEERVGELPDRIIPAIKALFTLPQKSPLYFLGGIAFVWTAWSALNAFWTTFATLGLGLTRGGATQFIAILALSYLVGAIPSGMIAARIGRKRTMMAGLLLLIPLYAVGAFATSQLLFAIMLGFMGMAWALVLVNGVILFQEFAAPHQIGLFTGFYAIGTNIAQIVGPIVYGFLMDVGGPSMLFGAGIVALLIGTAIFNRVEEGRVRMAPAAT